MKLVRFVNGKYGVRRWLFGYEYLDLQNGVHWWSRCHSKDWWQGTRKQAEDAMFHAKDKGTPVA